MSASNGKDIIRGMFRDVLQSSDVDVSVIEQYVDPAYVQSVDGITIDYPTFIAHMRRQKEVVASISVDFLAIVQEGDVVFTNHVVTAKKNDGKSMSAKVLAQFTLRDNRLVACDELTRLLSGDEADRNLGSRH